MPLSPNFLKDRGHPLIIAEADETFADVERRLQQQQYQAERTFVLLNPSPQETTLYQIAFYTNLYAFAAQSSSATILADMPFVPPQRVLDIHDENISAAETQTWLRNNPDEILLVIDGDNPLVVLTNQMMSGRRTTNPDLMRDLAQRAQQKLSEEEKPKPQESKKQDRPNTSSRSRSGWTGDILNRGRKLIDISPFGASSKDDTFEEAKTSTPPDTPVPMPVPVTPDVKHPVCFSAAYPAQMMPNQRYGFYVYAYREELEQAIQQNIAGIQSKLGDRPSQQKSDARLLIAQGTPLTVSLEAPDMAFFPRASITQIWRGDWLRFDFGISYLGKMTMAPVHLRVSISLGAIEVASITMTTQIMAQVDNPLMQAKLNEMLTAKTRPYRKIFISYSRRDTPVIDAYYTFQSVTDEVFVDRYKLRSGESWQAGLARAIDESDIFMLFWSQRSAGSSNVRDEWMYALEYRCAQNRCINFIRPVFWENPMAKVPDELGHLNFKFMNLGGLSSLLNAPLVQDINPKPLLETQQVLLSEAPIIAENSESAGRVQAKITVLEALLAQKLATLAYSRRLRFNAEIYSFFEQCMHVPQRFESDILQLLDALSLQLQGEDQHSLLEQISQTLGIANITQTISYFDNHL